MVVISMNDIHPDLLKRYAQGRCTEAEQLKVEYWLEHGDLDAPEEPVSFSGTATHSTIKAELWKGLVEKGRRNQQGKLRKKWIFGLSIAATLLLVGSMVFFKGDHSKDGQTQMALLQYTAPKGKVVKLTLSDGSIVTLSGGSSLQYPRQFAEGSRTVHLLGGKAFFAIAHQPERPFVVKSSETRITVLGTRFNVDLSHTPEIKVTLSQGSIAFKGKKQQHRLRPGEQLRYDQVRGEITSLVSIDTNLVTGWTSGTLWFQQTPINEALSQLEIQYGVRFKHTGSPDLTFPLSGKFKRQPLSRILHLIENSSELKFEPQSGDSIVVR